MRIDRVAPSGAPPSGQSASTRRSVDTAWPRCRTSTPRRRRCCGPPTLTSTPPRSTSTGPRTLMRIRTPIRRSTPYVTITRRTRLQSCNTRRAVAPLQPVSWPDVGCRRHQGRPPPSQGAPREHLQDRKNARRGRGDCARHDGVRRIRRRHVIRRAHHHLRVCGGDRRLARRGGRAVLLRGAGARCHRGERRDPREHRRRGDGHQGRVRGRVHRVRIDRRAHRRPANPGPGPRDGRRSAQPPRCQHRGRRCGRHRGGAAGPRRRVRPARPNRHGLGDGGRAVRARGPGTRRERRPHRPPGDELRARHRRLRLDLGE